MSTRAIRILRQGKVPHTVLTYHHLEKGAVFAARAVGFPLNQTIKTLVADLGGGKYCLALTPGDRQLSLKLLAKAVGVKKAGMAEVQTAQRLTGYLVGGISPFGVQRPLPVVMEKDLLAYTEVLINAGRRGIMLKMAPDAIVSFLLCTIARISDPKSGQTPA